MILKSVLIGTVLAFTLQVAAVGQTSTTGQPQASGKPQSPTELPAPTGPVTKDAQGPTLQTIDNHKGNRIRVAADADWSEYAVLRFQPSVYEPVNPEHGLKPDDSLKVTAEFDESLRAQFPNAGQGNGTVLEVRPVITDVKRTSTLANVVSFAALQVIVSYGAAYVRYELIDAQTGRQVGEISSERNARPWNVSPLHFLQNFESLGQSSVILKGDAKNLRKDLDRLAKTAKAPGAVESAQLE